MAFVSCISASSLKMAPFHGLKLTTVILQLSARLAQETSSHLSCLAAELDSVVAIAESLSFTF